MNRSWTQVNGDAAPGSTTRIGWGEAPDEPALTKQRRLARTLAPPHAETAVAHHREIVAFSEKKEGSAK